MTTSNATDANTTAAGPSQPRKSQATSCAECRRLKLKCDRVFPCSSCIRRGCANLCPTGTLEKGKRGFLRRLEQSLPSNPARSSSETLGEQSSEVAMFVARDAAMSKRIQDLEAALANAGIPIPTQSAPIATSNKRPRSNSNFDAESQNPPSTSQLSGESTDAAFGFGTLSIDVENRSRYIGPSGASVYLNADLWNSLPVNAAELGATDYLAIPPELVSTGIEAQIIAKMSCLPTLSEVHRLADIFFENASYIYEVVPRKRFYSSHLPAIYPSSNTTRKPINLSVLSLVAMVLACGAYFDLEVPTVEAKRAATEFYDLAIKCLYVSTPIDGGLRLETIPAVQTVHLMALYHINTRDTSDGEPGWHLLGIAMRSLQAQGCHRDGSRWGLPAEDLEERRRVFWETHTYDRLQSMTFGRPYALSEAHHDCEFPQTCDTPLPSDSDPTEASFSHVRWHHHRFRFAKLIGRMTDLAFSAKHPGYPLVIQIDKEINDFYAKLPPWAICPLVETPVKELSLQGEGRKEDFRRIGQVYSFTFQIFTVFLHLHRGPFCRALLLYPKDLIRSRYEQSIRSLLRAAKAITDIARGMFCLYPTSTCRTWHWFFFTFTAAACQAVLVIVAPFHPLAPAAFASMQQAAELLSVAEGARAELAAARLRPLAARASVMMEAYRNASLQCFNARDDAGNPPVYRAGNGATFPESNMRGNPEDLLGASTRLIRPNEHIDPMSGDGAAFPDLGSGASLFDGAQQQSSTTSWAGLDFPGVEMSDEMFDQFMIDWKKIDWKNNVDALAGETHSSIAPGLPPDHWSMNLNIEGFDLSGFIQNGAESWLMDSTSHSGSE